ncbi:hypothetical protein JYP51_03480 [Ponticoccus gilvus]|nr:hypothetical protein [Enemella evansiae]
MDCDLRRVSANRDPERGPVPCPVSGGRLHQGHGGERDGTVDTPVSCVQTTAKSEHGVEADYANADIDDYVQFDVHLRPCGVSALIAGEIGVLLEVFGRDGAVQGWTWYHWNHDRIEQTGGGACNVELARFYDGMRRVSLSVPAGSGAGDVTCRLLSVDPAAVWLLGDTSSYSDGGR